MTATTSTILVGNFLFFCLLFAAGHVRAEDACAAISCDCGSLPMDAWKRVCKQRELGIMRECNRNPDSLTLYCAAHGLGATHLPLALKIQQMPVVEKDEIRALNRKVAALYWSVRQGVYSVEVVLGTLDEGQAEKLLQAISHNIDTLFGIQQQVSTSWHARNRMLGAQEAWSNYSSDTLDMAKNLLLVGKKVWQESGTDTGADRKNQESVALRLIENSGKAYEHSAYAFGMANEHDNAARAWRRAAEISGLLIEIKSVHATPEEVQFLNYQKAARLYRATFHWVKDKRETEVENSLEKAHELLNGSGDPVLG